MKIYLAIGYCISMMNIVTEIKNDRLNGEIRDELVRRELEVETIDILIVIALIIETLLVMVLWPITLLETCKDILKKKLNIRK